jgi:prepilin-type N-terminal cleavage/methylation domain-containing protein
MRIKKNMNKKQHQQFGEDGFTIIELIIATAVLSLMLVLITVLMINIGNLYYKGINQSRVQDSVRNINDSIGDQIKLSDNAPTPGTSTTDSNTHAYCIGDKRYTYVLGAQIGKDKPVGSTNPYLHVLWEDTNPSPGTCFISPPAGPGQPGSNVPVDLTKNPASNDPDGSGTELIAPNSRLTAFCIGAFVVPSSCSAPSGTPPTNSSYPTYMLTISEASGDSDLLTNTSLFGQNYNTVCSGGLGDQFCATARLQTMIVPRQ